MCTLPLTASCSPGVWVTEEPWQQGWMGVSLLVALPPSWLHSITLQSQEGDHTHFKRTAEDFNGLSVLFWNFVEARKNRAYLSALLPRPGEIIRRPESEYLIILGKKCGWYSGANVERSVGLRFPLSSAGKLSVCVWITSKQSKTGVSGSYALLNKSVLFGKVSYMTFFFLYLFWRKVLCKEVMLITTIKVFKFMHKLWERKGNESQNI